MTTVHRFGSQLALVVFSWLVLGAPQVAQAQGTITASGAQASPGGVAVAPISIQLPGGQQVVTLQFNVTVVPTATAPVLAGPIGFAHSLTSPRQGPNFNANEGVDTVLIGWLQDIAPPLAGTVALGTVNVPIPAAAQPGDQYQIEIRNPSGASDLITEVPLNGANGEITVVPGLPACVGDCDDDGRVVVSELVRGVRIALSTAILSECPAFNANGDGGVTVEELVAGVRNALQGCPSGE